MRFSRIWVLIFVPLAVAATDGPRCPPAVAAADCTEDRKALDDYFFNVKGKVMIISYGIRHFHLICRSDVQLDSKALPRFANMTVVPIVKLSACAPPEVGFVEALLALNVTVRSALQLEDVPPAPSLAARHLRGLQNIRAFELSAPAAPAPLLQLEASFLEPFRMLLDLTLSRVALSSEAALRLPVSLRALTFYDVGLSALPAPVFTRLPALVRLALRDSVLEELDISTSLSLAVVEVNAPLNGIALGPRVENATLQNVRSFELRGNCSGLRRLRAEGAGAPLPDAWLVGCPVRELRLVRLRPGALGSDELRGAKDLLLLEARGCDLRSLPPGWIDDSSRLEKLDLSNNKLENIPSEIIAASPALSKVVLSENRLKGSAVGALIVASLTLLVLDDNPLGNLCGPGADTDYVVTNAVSVLLEARALNTLSLRHTGIARICRDWRQLPRLVKVDLRDNNITDLEYDDLQWSRTEPTVVDLRGNPVRRVSYTREQYERVRARPPPAAGAPPPPVRLSLDSRLLCDCTEYWFALALRARPRHGQAALRALCRDGRALDGVPPALLTCDVPQEMCPERCSCSVDGEHSHIACRAAGLRVAPAAPRLPPPATLLLAGNRITDVANLTDFGPGLKTLDLSDNLIEHIDAATVDELFADGRKVVLDGNPLSCGCGDAALQRALAERGAGGASGERCRAAAEAECATALWALPAVVAPLVAAAALVACVVRPSTRRRIKIFLFERGMCARWALGAPADPAAEAARDYDAFVSFSHHDAEYAAALAARLERGPGARRLCLHERDWTPGEWIPAQIASSVQRSRRTVALVSDSFLASAWARAELREAYGAALREGRARLLAVLLPGLQAPRAAAAPELAAYLAAVTYLRWDDPHFWDKLLLAIPPPPAPPPPPPPPPAGARPPSP